MNHDEPQSCPTAKDLQRFLASNLSESELERIEAHLDTCAACRERIEAAPELTAWGDDVRWATLEREQAPVDVNVPLARLNALLSDYEVLGEIGRGGMGIVYRARQLKLNRLVALKVLPALLGVVRPDAVQRFRREAELAARLKHSNIIAVYDYGEIDGTLYYAMELIEGRSLREILGEIQETEAIDVVLGANVADASSAVQAEAGRVNGAPGAPAEHPTTPNPKSTRTRIGSSARTDREYYHRVAEWMAEVAEGLDYAHQQGVIHRDIKPSNLLLNTEGRLMISDFGLARAPGPETLTGSRALLGTARYMSPEQVDDESGVLDRRVDVYGLGATLYELLAFQPLFTGVDDREVLHQVLHQEPLPPHRFARPVPRELETICLKAVEKDRNNRYESAKAMADDLRRWLLDLPILARRPSVPARALKFVRRRKPSVAAVCLLCGLAAAAAFWFVQSQKWRGSAQNATARAATMELELGRAQIQSEVDSGELDQALGHAESLLQRYPGSTPLHVLHARVLHQLDRGDEGIAELEQVVAREPENWGALFQLSLLYRDAGHAEQEAHYAALSAARMPADSQDRFLLLACMEPQPERALEIVDQGLQHDPQDIGLVLHRAGLDQQLQRSQEMLRDAQRAVAMRPQWSLCQAYLGAALNRAERYEDAIAAFSRAIELEAGAYDSWVGRAVAHNNLEQFEAALFDADKAITLYPKYGQAYAARGYARAGLGEMAAGITDCGKAIELEPDDPDNYLERLSLYSLLGDWEKVAADAARVVELRPEDPRGYAFLAQSYARRSLYQEAIQHFTRAIELDPAHTLLIHDRGTCFLRLGRLDEALADYSLCISIDPKFLTAYLNRAQTYWHMDKQAEAMADLTRAKELGDDGATAALMRSEGNFRLGHYADAIADCTRVLELSPDELDALLRRGMACELLGRPDDAAADYDRLRGLGGEAGAYGRLARYFLHGGPEPDGADEMADNSGRTAWTGYLLAFASGKIAGEELLAAALTEAQRADAYYYIGRRALLDGDSDQAQEAFSRCVSFDIPGLLEVQFARALLGQSDGHAPASD